MDGIAKSSLAVSMIALLVGASCARSPREEKGPPSGAARSTDGNSPSGVPPAASSAPIPQPPTPNEVSATDVTDSQHQGVKLPPPRYFGPVGEEIDFNSGDLRWTRAVTDYPPRYEIYETGLSRELRRLGIPIPEQRRWVHTSSWSSGAMFADTFRGHVLPRALDLLKILEEVNASDEQRRDVLQRLMTTWRGDGGPLTLEARCRRLRRTAP
jgi:hypothetical protein